MNGKTVVLAFVIATLSILTILYLLRCMYFDYPYPFFSTCTPWETLIEMLSLELKFKSNYKGMALIIKMALYCPQGSGTFRQQLLMMHGIALYCMVLHGIACGPSVTLATVLLSVANEMYVYQQGTSGR